MEAAKVDLNSPGRACLAQGVPDPGHPPSIHLHPLAPRTSVLKYENPKSLSRGNTWAAVGKTKTQQQHRVPWGTQHICFLLETLIPRGRTLEKWCILVLVLDENLMLMMLELMLLLMLMLMLCNML